MYLERFFRKSKILCAIKKTLQDTNSSPSEFTATGDSSDQSRFRVIFCGAHKCGIEAHKTAKKIQLILSTIEYL